MEDHRYSTFALDLYWAAPGDPELEQHVASCDACRAYLDHLGAVDRPIALPARKRSWWPALIAVLAIAIVTIIAWPRHHAPVIATKGEPGVQLLVHRGSETIVWDAMPVRAQDALALRVACEGMTDLSVLVPDRTGWQVAFEGRCQDGVLPFTLVVDDQPGSEQIAVVLGKAPLDAAAAQHAAELATRSAALWTTRFTLSKETP